MLTRSWFLGHLVLCISTYDYDLQPLFLLNCSMGQNQLAVFSKWCLGLLEYSNRKRKWEIYIYSCGLPFSIVVDLMGHLEKELWLQPLVVLELTVAVDWRRSSRWTIPRIYLSCWWRSEVAETVFPDQYPDRLTYYIYWYPRFNIQTHFLLGS